ncbi:Tubulin epsilon chain [Ilyodon furcidens]|uniref:Tubulin epsilon chain n=1 Tax=Ilyodon furcidens TaxID=33524 RepID=A0ABV0THT1_9TELE
MEEGVVNGILQGPLREVFDSTQLLTDVSGSGNNWAVGHLTYGSAYRDSIVNTLRKTAEHCDCLQCFFLIHSMGGGTGSGLGTRVLSLLEEEFSDVCRIVTAMYPSAEDDVITSPYNSVLAMRELTEHADCVLPVENQSLVDIVNKISLMSHGAKPGCVLKKDCTVTSGHGSLSPTEKPFDAMNNIVANLLLNITSSARFEGSLNMDLNEIAMNLVPFPRLHYLVPSLTPLYTLADVNIPTRSRTFDTRSSTDVAALKSPRVKTGRGGKFRCHFQRVSRDDATEAHIWRDKSSQANLCSTRPFLEELESWKSV